MAKVKRKKFNEKKYEKKNQNWETEMRNMKDG